jgi:hypothetical protein
MGHATGTAVGQQAVKEPENFMPRDASARGASPRVDPPRTRAARYMRFIVDVAPRFDYARTPERPGSRRTVRCSVRDAEEAGLEDVKPHDLRPLVGTQLTAGDIRKAQKPLGQKRIGATAPHYVLDDVEPGLTDDLS